MICRDVFWQLEILQRSYFRHFYPFLLRAFGEQRNADVGVFRVGEDCQATKVHDAQDGGMFLEGATERFSIRLPKEAALYDEAEQRASWDQFSTSVREVGVELCCAR